MSSAELERLQLLQAMHLIDATPEPIFDRITRLLALALDVPIAAITFVDGERLSLKSRVGLSETELPLEQAICAHTLELDSPLIVPDTHAHPALANHPLVVGAPRIRFYAGVPLRTSQGQPIGTLCALDRTPRELTAEQQQTLEDLAELVVREVHLRETRRLSSRVLEHSDARAAASEERFREVFERAGVGIAIVAPDGRWQEVNDELCSFLGYSREELADLTFQDLTEPADLDSDLALLEALVAGHIPRYQIEKRYIRKDGALVWASLMVTAHRTGRTIDYFIAVVKDIQAAKEAEAALSALRHDLEQQVESRTRQLRTVNQALSEAMHQQLASEQSLRKREAELTAILETANDAYVSMNEAGRITAWNRMAEVTFGWSRDEALGRPMEELIIPAHQHEMHRHSVAQYFITGLTKMVGQRREVLAKRRDGSLFPIEVRVSVLELNGQKIFSAFMHEISERKLLEERREREALQDPLTGLPNRRALFENLTRAMERVRRKNNALALVFLDLDGFKPVNDSLGHDAGDLLLQEIAARLRASLRTNDSVYRLAGDEFTIVLEGLSDPQTDAMRIAEKILQAVITPVSLGQDSAHVGTSIGITLYQASDARSLEQLLRDADAAMYQAKRSGKGRICIR